MKACKKCDGYSGKKNNKQRRFEMKRKSVDSNTRRKRNWAGLVMCWEKEAF